jgi:hypothetical protein
VTRDVHLHCKRTLLRNRRVLICEPEELRGTPGGEFKEPPSEWRSPDRLGASVDVLDVWARKAVGVDILRAINQYALQSPGLLRVLISSDEALRSDTLAAPWELLEHTPSAYRSAQLSVVRLFEADAPASPSDSVTRIRLLILYANPRSDIEQLDTHIAALKNFAEENNEKLEAKFIYFRGAAQVRSECLGFDPHVTYFIGHGEQSGAAPVQLQIGSPELPSTIDLARFADLVRQLGSPRVLILNACDTFIGPTLDPYLGAALRLAPQFDFVVAMQMKEPIKAATDFAAMLLAKIASGAGFAQTMIAARTAMAAQAERAFEVTPYIPVLIQRTRQDVPFSVDADEHELVRLQKLMAVRLERVNRLHRTLEDSVRRVLTGDAGANHVSFLAGPRDCGKSTTVRGVLEGLLTLEAVKRGDRYLYFSGKDLSLVSDASAQIPQLLQAFARACPAFTEALSEALVEAQTRETSLAVFAAWLERRKQARYRLVIVLDDLPSSLATDLAAHACGIVTAGHLMLISESDALAPQVPVERLTMGMMTEQEIAAGLAGRSPTEIQEIAAKSGGVPLFVMALAQKNPVPMQEFIARVLAPLSPAQKDVLKVIAIAGDLLYKEVAQELGIDQSTTVSLLSPLLINATHTDALTVPKPVRAELLRTLTPADEVALRERMAVACEDIAEREQTGGFRRTRVISLYGEALRQRTLLLDHPEAQEHADENLAAARCDAFDLDYELLEEGDEPAAAKAMWNLYQSAAAKAGLGEEREIDARYARCLQRVGFIEEAEEILAMRAEAPVEDELQIQILLQRADVVKALGPAGSLDNRLRILTRARAICDKLRGTGKGSAELDALEGDIEQSIGNTLGYGQGARPEEAAQHLERAQAIFEQLQDYRADRAYAEKVEIKRYNELLTETERVEAIQKIKGSTEGLLSRSVKRETVLRLYELGRLERDPCEKARWYEEAYERAEGRREPLVWHAAIHWRCAEVECGKTPFAAAVPQLLAYCEKLEHWREQAWSRRVLRDCLFFLAERYAASGEAHEGQKYFLRCRAVVDQIAAHGEGRRDRRVHAAVDEALQKSE